MSKKVEGENSPQAAANAGGMSIPLTIYRHASDSESALQAEVPWETLPGLLVGKAAKKGPPEVKTQGLCWSPVRLKPGKTRRANSNVGTIGALVLDFDYDPAKGMLGATLEQAQEVWGSWAGWAHTSWSHDVKGPRCRVALPLSREATPKEYRQLWQWAVDRSKHSGLVPDESAKDVSRMWFFPYQRGAWREVSWGGPRLSVTEILAGALEEERLGAPTGLVDGWKTDQLFRSAVGPVSIADWAKTAQPGEKLKGHCPAAGEDADGEPNSSYGCAFLRRTAGGVMFVCTSGHHGHGDELKLWWQDPDVKGRKLSGDRNVMAMLDWKLNAKGQQVAIKATAHNTVTILTYDPRWQGRLWLDGFRRYRMVDAEPLEDRHYMDIHIWLERAYPAGAWSYTTTVRAIETVCDHNERDPLIEDLESMVWDGVKRLDTWLVAAAGVKDTKLHRAYSRKFLLSAVWRAYDPGHKADHVLVLVGPQGVGKSTLFDVLAGEEWFSDSFIDLRSKDAYTKLDGVWIYEIAEMSGLNRADVDRVKDFLSSRIDQYRPAYGRAKVVRKRRTVFAATTNDYDVLKDFSGDRRFWVVETGGTVDIDWLKKHRTQLWAEARVAMEAGEECHLDRAMENDRARANSKFVSEDPWSSSVVAMLGINKVTTITEIMLNALQLSPDRQTIAATQRVSRILQKLPDWQRDRVRVGDTVVRYYHHSSVGKKEAREMMKQREGAVH